MANPNAPIKPLRLQERIDGKSAPESCLSGLASHHPICVLRDSFNLTSLRRKITRSFDSFKMTEPGKRASPKGRLTSSGLHPMRGVPPPERLVAKRTRAAVTQILGENSLSNEWQAGVSKVEKCSLVEYDGGRGLKTIFSKERDQKGRCNILCSGNTSKLAISLELAERHRDPSPHILHRFELRYHRKYTCRSRKQT